MVAAEAQRDPGHLNFARNAGLPGLRLNCLTLCSELACTARVQA
jgi:hypothetical protein